MYRINRDGTGYAIVHAFGATGDGWGPSSGVIEGADGMLYGTTLAGGTSGYGAIYRINKDGSGLTVLRSFANASTEGCTPVGRLLDGPGGKLYGTTAEAGTANVGTVFSMSKDGTGYTVLHQFAGGATDGATPYGGLFLASDGRLYGATSAGGAGTKGTVYGMNADGTGYTVLKMFAGGPGDGAVPYYGTVTEKNGALFGVTNLGGPFEGGTLYKVNKDGTGFSILINFGLDASDGRVPGAGLFQASDGAFYGTTNYGGSGGTVFRLLVN